MLEIAGEEASGLRGGRWAVHAPYLMRRLLNPQSEHIATEIIEANNLLLLLYLQGATGKLRTI